MKHLRLLVIITFLVLVALTGTAVLHGRALSPDSTGHAMQAMGLDTCNGRLCFMQLVPGITTMTQAKEILSQYTYRDDGADFHSQIGNLQIRVDVGYGSAIAHVDIQAFGSAGSSFSVPFSEIIAQFGTPCYVTTYSRGYGPGGGPYSNGTYASGMYVGSQGLSLIYPSFVLEVSTEDQGRLSLDSMISGITLQSDAGGNSNLCEGYSSYGTPWRGFASVDVYQAEGQLDR